ncbi:glycosyltransferase family 2 protein [Rhizobium sp. BK068]|uniref:glycosyltransferase family 2 protein n=1 Tax=Rhizobium sp. BK068 TaxID=2512130 RepID=UPI00104B39F9|nr:glycosyltransferase family 2 protein [Rhizobium sp. BK068]TCM63886.1 dolichol-phosphate mannosyltransferase [Rhizobium sp. BK068]
MNDQFAKNGRPLISISIPVLNEEGNIQALYSRLSALAINMQDKCDLEFVFSDNHSSDRTWHMLGKLAQNDPRVKAIRFSRNFGFQRSILANYLHTRGDAVMQIDADLQDPPEMLQQFFELWQGGHEVVYGVRRSRPESFLISTFRRVGYWIIDKVSEHPIPRNVGDFRLIDRKVIAVLSRIKASSPYLRGEIAGLGFSQIGVPYDRDPRVAGQSKFNVARLVRLGLTAVLNHSTVPLRAASFLGGIMLALSIVGAMYYAGYRLMHPDFPVGIASLHILVLFGIGLNAFLLGVIGEYILRIYLVLRSEPVAIIERSLNFQPSELKPL